MFKPFLVTALIIWSAAAAAKSGEDDFIAQRKDSVIGYAANKTPLRAVCYSFPRNIYRISIDKEQNNAVLLLKEVDEKNRPYGDGELSLLNFESGAFDWHFKVMGNEVRRTRNTIFYQSKAETYVFSVADKKRLPTSISSFWFLGYDNDVAYDGIAATDLKTGKWAWKHAMQNKDAMIEEYRQINDSMVAFSCAGLHVLNMHTGKGWDVASKTMVGMSMSVAFGVGNGSGLMPVVVVPITGAKPAIRVNIVTDDQQVYFADREAVRCWNVNTGELLWKSELPLPKTPGSELFKVGDNIYLLNTGVREGHAFIAGYNCKTGNKLFFEDLGDAGVSSAAIQDGACFLYNGSVYKIDLQTGKYTTVKPGGEPGDKWLASTEDIFTEQDNDKITSLQIQYPGAFASQDDAGTVEVYNEYGEIIKTLKPEDYWTINEHYKNNRILYRADHKLIIERNGQKLAMLAPAMLNQVWGDKLYRVVDKGLQVISLPEALSN